MNYDKMTKAELIDALRSLESAKRVGLDPADPPSRATTDDGQLLLYELQVHQLELEMQNRELREAQSLLEESRDRYSELYDFAPVGYVSLDERGCIQEINLSGAALLGRERSHLLGKPFIHCVSQRDIKTVLDHLQRCRQAREKVTAEVSLTLKDGESIQVQLLSLPVKDAEQHVIGCRTAMTDITERKRTEEERDQLLAGEQAARREAETANRTKNEFLAVVSHELRTPLTAMLGWARMLRSGNLEPATIARALEVIERSAKAQAQLIDDLLDVSRIITGKLQLDSCLVELIPIIKSAVEAIQPAADAKNLQLDTMLDPGASPILGDPDRLQQVIGNLLANAIKFTPQGGRIEVRLARVDLQAEIQIRDTGVGIRTEFLPYVFDRFRQIDKTSRRSHSGLGLGLAIVRHLVDLHGGTAHVESEGEGRGTTAVIRLPITVEQAKASVPKRELRMAGRPISLDRLPVLDGLWVLVVDDDPDTRALITLMLEQRGAKTVAVASVADALVSLERVRPDVLVSDIGMPGEDGYELIRKVRALPPERGGKIPALALTAYAGVEDRLRVLSVGYQMHVAKPVELTNVAMEVARLAGRAEKPGIMRSTD